MAYIFRGRLCGLICPECPEPMSNVKVRLYGVRAQQNVAALAVASPKETFAILTDDMVQAKGPSLIAETETDAEGRFAFQLGENEKYGGEAFEVDVYCGTVPRRKSGPNPPRPVQFSITTIQPLWRQTETGFAAVWDYCLPARLWCAVRARFGAWVICGRLTTCKDHVPIPGATVKAFDVDWLEDDPLGVAVTDATGRFRIDYLTEDFQRTPFSPLINVEWISGPDVYFSVELGGQVILAEPRSTGRAPGRENVGTCLCVELCSDKVQPAPPDQLPHWQKVWDFDIHPFAPNPASSFSIEGYAGGAANSFVFSGGIPLRGNCPLRNVAAPANSLEYRFVIGEWTWLGGGDGDPTALPTVAPASLHPVTQIFTTTVGYVFYTNGLGMPDSAPVNISSADVGADGWIRIDGKSVTVDMRNGNTSTVTISDSNFLRTFDLEIMNSNAISAAHPVRMPGGLPKADAGRSLTTAEKEPIRRYRLQFEVRDAVTLGTVYTDTLDSIVIDNRAVVLALDLEELRLNACNPLAGAPNAHILYTIDHPHLRFFNIQISNNNGVVHPAPPLPNGSFLPGPNFFFRGGAGGPHLVNGTGGFSVNISGDPTCAYAVVLSWQTRHYLSSATSTQILYCK
ncbi:MAG: hypothetical protein HYY65_03725 [Candidatus Tectomicrobia bacterium]|uniref:Carboxypeptidase regulatory-like domain-containing protein n=1 Tax=Tectimicrobiota bacterium TaxID=2528274 RepID=A0A932GNI3_UNCTE|nr:hypothetical protein [Candidatus Tectomicrobia bacterium]